MKGSSPSMRRSFRAVLLVTALGVLPLVAASPAVASQSSIAGMRDVPDPLYGVTVDDVGRVPRIVDAVRQLPKMPTTRIVFDEGVAPGYYAPAVAALQPYSYLMGELLDSSAVRATSVQAYVARARDYVSQFASQVDIWEVGNEVNGEWLGATPDVVAKIGGAYDVVKNNGKRAALTLYYNPNCGNAAHQMMTWARANVPDRMRLGLDYVQISYYPDACNGYVPPQSEFQGVFDQLHAMFPNSRLGFGEVGLVQRASSTSMARARQYMAYFYGLHVTTPNYVGGYFWWYFYEDCTPSSTKPLFGDLTAAFNSMPIPSWTSGS